MNVEEFLKEAQGKQQATVERINTLDREKQQLLQEALKLEGEIRVLKRLTIPATPKTE
jgi:hypothetical protein